LGHVHIQATKDKYITMPSVAAQKKQLILNAFDMSCIGHQSPGQWRKPGDKSPNYKDLEYWTDLAKLLERGKIHGIFLADVLGSYDVYQGLSKSMLKRYANKRQH
jgi:hypothetical protein